MTWTCPRCGNPNLMEYYVCSHCGAVRRNSRFRYAMRSRARAMSALLDWDR